MKSLSSKFFLSSVLALSLAACGTDNDGEIAGDDENGSFGGAGAKSDSQFSECQLRNVLLFVNASTTTEEVLVQTIAPLQTRNQAAKNIITHRDGDPSTTGDDNLFDDLNELDGIRFVGVKTLQKIIDSIAPKCVNDLATRPFIDSTTFTGTGGLNFKRDAIELEATFAVSGIPSRQLRDILLSKDDQDRTTFSRIRKNGLMEAFTYGYELDEMPWDSDSHNLREEMPYIYFTIEPGRFEAETDDNGVITGPREISLGTDYNDDIYFDTPDFSVTHSGMSLRGRVRWDTPTEIRRILVAAKSSVEVDDSGIKRAAKVDVREDFPDLDFVDNMANDIMSGSSEWNGELPPVNIVYNTLLDQNVLPDIDGREKVLLLDPVAHLRSTRSRFHFNEAALSSIASLRYLAADRVVSVGELAKDKVLVISDANDKVRLNNLIEMAEKIQDRSMILDRVNSALADAGIATVYDIGTLPSPDDFERLITSEAKVQEIKVVADTISDIMHEFADQLDDVDRALTDGKSEFKDHAETYVLFLRSKNSSFAVKQAYDVFFEEFLASTDISAAVADYNAFGEMQKANENDDFEDFEPISEANWQELGNAVEFEMIKVYQRQIEMSGTLAKGLWFDASRKHYVPLSSRRTSNFLIDTTDMTDFLTHEEWESIPEDARTIDKDLPGNKIFHTTFVNEVQIELGLEKVYLDRIAELKEKIDAGNGTSEDEAAIKGAEFIFNEYRASLTFLAELKEDRIEKYLERGGAQDFTWEAATHSKGHTALLIIADEL